MAGALGGVPGRLLIVATELFASGGVQCVGREAVSALATGAADPLSVWSFRDATMAPPYSMPRGTELRLAGRSRLKLGSWAIARAARRCDDLLVLLMHIHVAPIAVPMLLRGARVAVFLHGVEVWRPLTAAQRFVVERSEQLIANSSYTAGRFAEANPWFDTPSVEVCPLGIPFAPQHPGDPIAADVALMVSRMSSEDRYKGHERLIRAWPAVRARMPTAKLTLVGDGDDRPRLESVAAEAGMADAVLFVGNASDQDLAEWYRRCTFFVLPSDGEGFGLVFLEAMRAGKACIGGPGAPAEIIEDGVTGVIVPSGDDESLVGALSRLFLDHELRDRLGRNGHARFVQTFTARHFEERLRRLVTLPAAPEHAA
jgi:phosphatidylinositol alpha-1,6-mannosyltransferase